METIFNNNFCEEQALIESTRLDNQPMPGDIVEYTTRYGDWYPDAHIDEVNENGISICEVASVPYVSKHNGKLSLGSVSGGSWTTIPTKLHKIGQRLKTFYYYTEPDILTTTKVEFQAKVNVWAYTEPNPLFGEYTTRLYRRFHVYFGKKPDDIFGYRIFVNENFTAFHNEQEYIAWLKTYKGVEFKTETGRVVFLYRKQELLIPKKDWDNLSLPIDTRLINGLIDIKYQVDDESKVITEYRYTNQNDCKVCHYEKPYGKASESL